MKKLMFAMAVAACAAAVQASTLTYGATAGAVDASKVETGTAYAMWAPTGTTIDWWHLANKDSYSLNDFTALGLKRVTSGGDNFSFAFSGSKLTDEKGSVLRSDVGGPSSLGSTTVDMYVVIVETEGSDVAYSGVMSTTIQTMPWNTDVSAVSSSFSYGSATAIPEPTSGLLLLLGVAGLALKRKRA